MASVTYIIVTLDGFFNVVSPVMSPTVTVKPFDCGAGV